MKASCVVSIFTVRAKKWNLVMVGVDTIARGTSWCVSSRADLYIICKIRMSSVRG